MRIATWNINGVKARIDSLTRWLEESAPDIACLQEIKSQDETFPAEAIERLGYNIATHGQKGFNGVALLSKRPLEDVMRRLPGDDADEHSRYIEATVSTDTGAVRVASIYLPNGNPIDTEKYPYKLAWMDRLLIHAEGLLATDTPIVLAGDYNVIPLPDDARHPDRWTDDALFQPESRAKHRALVNLGYTDAQRAVDNSDGIYTFWDYQAGAWQKNNGIRIDHLMLSPQAADRLTGVTVEKQTRGWTKPSDHVPVVATLDL
ncbi:exodeoxyribonuclease III [Acuticoccus sp. MNP-M23]|uniref:exodeoxyribonuclease III n=1 Tax=Acuticoccus sp. MNP-M23 TaxID=3072793 RepID=UPI002814C8B6|nr:exodeoxyribonuclease III [Acuticoccus sp. MNP-M23]WMS42425.1 exodeoxyribonuclease III [Acuticoccus sp. MNP-M23]